MYKRRIWKDGRYFIRFKRKKFDVYGDKKMITEIEEEKKKIKIMPVQADTLAILSLDSKIMGCVGIDKNQLVCKFDGNLFSYE